MKLFLLFLTNLFLAGALCQSKIDLAEKLVNDKKFEEAKKLLSPIDNKNKEYASAQYYLGIIAYKQKMFDDAADHFEEAIDANDKVADYYNRLGNTYGTIAQYSNLIIQGYLAPKMKNAWKKASELDPENTEARWALVQYYTQAPSFMGGSFEKARVMAEEIRKLNKAEGHRALGTIYQWENKHSDAEKEFIEMTKLSPALGYQLADYYAGQKKYDKAFNLLEDLLKKNPTDYLALYQFGKTSMMTGLKYDRAIDCLNNFLKYQPNEHEPSIAAANTLLARIYERRGNKSEAKKFYTAALKEDPKLKEAREGLDRMSE